MLHVHRPITLLPIINRSAFSWLVWLSCFLFLPACGISSYRIQDVAKSDTSLVFDKHYAQSRQLLRDFAIKLYKRNPNQLPSNILLKERIVGLFEEPDMEGFRECGGLQETQLMQQALHETFTGDRVFCLMAGLIGMINHSYGYNREFFFNTSLDEQKLYKSARNIERLAWRLSQTNQLQGQPVLLTNSLTPNAANLSFERLYGKLIAQQDLLAAIVADQNKRAINYMVRSLSSIFFLPL